MAESVLGVRVMGLSEWGAVGVNPSRTLGMLGICEMLKYVTVTSLQCKCMPYVCTPSIDVAIK